MKDSVNKQIENNRKSYNKNVNKYGNRHPEIYNELEQTRLYNSLATVIDNKTKQYLALDYGSGDGNLTKQLLKMGVTVTAADVSDRCLDMLNTTYGVDTILLDGKSASNIENDKYDFIGLYSVVHHIPDYVGVIEELTTKLKLGGVLYIDHESCPDYWQMDKLKKIKKFKKDAVIWKGKIRKYLRPRNYINKLWTIFVDPHYAEEGDLHVFPDDHLEWDDIIEKVKVKCEIISMKDYLLYNNYYDLDKFNKAQKEGLTDTICFIARRVRS